MEEEEEAGEYELRACVRAATSCNRLQDRVGNGNTRLEKQLSASERERERNSIVLHSILYGHQEVTNETKRVE